MVFACRECIKKEGLPKNYLGNTGNKCDYCGEIVINEIKCPNKDCFYPLVLLEKQKKYVCSLCKTSYNQNKLEKSIMKKFEKKIKKKRKSSYNPTTYKKYYQENKVRIFETQKNNPNRRANWNRYYHRYKDEINAEKRQKRAETKKNKENNSK